MEEIEQEKSAREREKKSYKITDIIRIKVAIVVAY